MAGYAFAAALPREHVFRLLGALVVPAQVADAPLFPADEGTAPGQTATPACCARAGQRVRHLPGAPVRAFDPGRVDRGRAHRRRRRIFPRIVLPLLRAGSWSRWRSSPSRLAGTTLHVALIKADRRQEHTPAGGAGLALARAHPEREMMMAGAVLTALPVLLLFLVLQRYIRACCWKRRGADGPLRAIDRRIRVFRWPCRWKRSAPLDDFRDPSALTATASRWRRCIAAAGWTRPAAAARALDYDFNGFSGYAVARRGCDRLSAQLRLRFPVARRRAGKQPRVRWSTPAATTWWVRKPDVALPAQWTPQSFKRWMVEFAWGPATTMNQRAAAPRAGTDGQRRQGAAARAAAASPGSACASCRWTTVRRWRERWRVAATAGPTTRPRARIRRRDPALESSWRVRPITPSRCRRRRALAQRPRSSRQRRRRGFHRASRIRGATCASRGQA